MRHFRRKAPPAATFALGLLQSMQELSALLTAPIAYGCMRISGVWQACQVTDEMRRAGISDVMTAFEAGYRVFDHADIYGQGECERIFGQALRENPGIREEMVIATKCGIRFAGEPEPGLPGRYDFSREHIIASCDGSLERLGVDCIDLYQLHRPDLLMDPVEVVDALLSLVEAGKIRWIGVSNFLPSTLALLQSALGEKIVTHQFELSLVHREPLFDGTLDQCQQIKVVPMAWGPLAGGRIFSTDPKDELSHALAKIATKHEATVGQVALAWIMRHPAGVMPVIGATDPARIWECIHATQLELTRGDWYTLLVAAQGHAMP